MATFFYRLYQLFIGLPLFLLSTLLTALSTAFGSIWGDHRFWGYHPGRLWGRFVCNLLFLPVKVERHPGISPTQSYIFVANHQSSMDIFLIYGYLGHHFKWMMKSAMRKVPFVGMACEKGQHIFVDRSSVSKIAQTIAHARHTLQDGMNLVVFPEGSRTYTGRMERFKKGAFQLSEELQLPIVPITIDGAFEVLPRTKGFSFVRRHSLRLVIHAPIAPPSQEQNNMKEVMEQAHDIINSALPTDFQ